MPGFEDRTSLIDNLEGAATVMQCVVDAMIPRVMGILQYSRPRHCVDPSLNVLTGGMFRALRPRGR